MFLAMDLSSIGYINYIFYLVLVLAILAGFLKGFKKSLFNLITMAIFYVVFFVTISQAVEFLWTFEMPWLGSIFGQVDSSLSGFTTFESSVQDFISIGLPNFDMAGASAEVMALVIGLMKFIVKIVWTLLYFTVVFVVYKLICLIIRGLFFKTKKGENKNRGLGTIIGGLNGVMAVFVLLIMLGGIMSVVESTSVLVSGVDPAELSHEVELNHSPLEFSWVDNTSFIYEEAEAENPLSEYADALAEMVETYNSNIVVKLANKITTTSTLNAETQVPLHIDLFDRVLSFEYNEEVVGLRYELSVFAQAADVFLSSSYYTTNELTDLTGDEIRDVFTYLSNSNLVTSLLPVAIEVATDMNEMDLPVSIEDLYAIDYETELANLGATAGALFDILNNADFIGGSGSVSEIQVTGDTVVDIFEDISESDVILLLTESVLLPMLTDPENEFSSILTVPDDLDIEAEFLALGDIFAEIVDADIDFSEFEDANVNVLLSAVSKIDLQVLKDSQLVSSALINILSGQAEIEGLDVLEVPTGLVWEDQGLVSGELTLILESLNVLAEVASDIDFDNLDVTVLTDLTDIQIGKLFDSYVIRATISEIVKTTPLGDIPLVLPDSIYDVQNYFTKEELVSVVKSVKLILTGAGDDFDIMQALNLSDTDISTLLESDIISATIGSEIYNLGTSSLVVPASTVSTILVDTMNVSVINETEITNVLKALSVLDIQSLDSMTFDAGIINILANQAETNIDPLKVGTLLDSEIIHATVSDMIIDLTGGILVIPDLDVTGAQLHYTVAGLEYISDSEITNLLDALYQIDITDFATMNFDDTSLLLGSLDELLVSSIIQATVSDQITDIGLLAIPEQDAAGNDVTVVQGTQTYIVDTELTNLIAVLNMLSLSPTELSDTFSLANFDTEQEQNTLLASAIMHATISKTLTDLGDAILIVPDKKEDGLADIKIETGSVGNETTFVLDTEIKAILNAFVAMDFLNLEGFSGSIDVGKFLDNAALMVESSSLQATMSDKILSGVSASLIIPDDVVLYNDTYIEKNELLAFINSINELGLDDFDTFGFEASDIFTVSDKDTFFNSSIMQATSSKYIIDISGDETSPTGTTGLLVPTTKRETIVVEAANTQQIEKQELIYIFEVLDYLGMDAFGDSIDNSIVQGKTKTEMMDEILISASFHVTLDNMLRDNPSIGDNIPNIAKGAYYLLATEITTKEECVDLIFGLNLILNGGNFMTTSLNVNDVLTMNSADRSVAVESLTIRQYITPGLELEALGSLTFSFDPINDYEVTDLGDPSILDYEATEAALAEFH